MRRARIASWRSSEYCNPLWNDRHHKEVCFRRDMMNVCLMVAPILEFIPSSRVEFVRGTHDERTNNVRPSHDSLAYLASRKNVLRFLCGSPATVLRNHTSTTRLSCGSRENTTIFFSYDQVADIARPAR